MMKFFVPALLTLLFSRSAFSQQDMQKEKDQLMKADIEFCRLSEARGSNAAFISYASDSAVMLRKNSYPVEGKSAITDLLLKRPDTTFTLSWKPTFADVASSGELGYTYGTYEVKSRHENKSLGVGTYVTIWKKDKEGNWKFVLDAGNEGLTSKK